MEMHRRVTSNNEVGEIRFLVQFADSSTFTLSLFASLISRRFWGGFGGARIVRCVFVSFEIAIANIVRIRRRAFLTQCNAGPAYYLAPLIPISASATPPSIPLLQRILYRFNLRTEVIALAGIILDTLSPQFVRKWRTELAQLSLWEDGGNKCEVLALVALGIAAKWIEDTGVSLTATTLSDISGGRFCPREINVTERLLLQDIAYDLKGLSCEEDLAWAVKEIQRCTAARVEKEIDL